MRNQRIDRNIADRLDTAADRPVSVASTLAFKKFYTSPVRPEKSQHASVMPMALSQRNTVELKMHVDGLPVVLLFPMEDVSKQRHGALANQADIHSLVSDTLEKIVDRIRGSVALGISSPGAELAAAKAVEEPDAIAAPSDAQTMLRVGPLELNLIDRTAKRGEREIDLRPREFRLLRYMMERRDRLLTRAKLLQEVWNYKFVPRTNLVDVHMGRLRRKVDGANEPAMIRSVRGAGFVLNANPLSQH